MRRARLVVLLGLVGAVVLAAAVTGRTVVGRDHPAAPRVHRRTIYLVLTRTPTQAATVAAELRGRGAGIRSVNAAIGMVEAVSDASDFRSRARGLDGVLAVAADRTIGRTPVERPVPVHTGTRRRASAPRGAHPVRTGDPLDSDLWDMRMIHADRAHAVSLGSRDVRVGVIDTGIQGDHPDLARDFDASLSRNFTVDGEGGSDDGPCEHRSCVDPVGEDDNGHGTHVAGIIAAALNGFGASGVAPDVTLISVRAGQDSGLYFAGPTVNALTYAADSGIDVVNMSFYVDPWLYNCQGGAPEDTPAQAADQDVIITAMRRALDYADSKDVTLVAAASNDHVDLAHPGTDRTSPDFGSRPHARTIDAGGCHLLPLEGPHVIGVSAVGPSGRKSDYSNWTTDPRSGDVEVAAPGGWFSDGPHGPTEDSEILSTAPLRPLREKGYVDAGGTIDQTGLGRVIRECQRGTPAPGTTRCGYYQWLQGTSMAAPHATGVAALAIAAHGSGSGAGFGLAPATVKRLMMSTATNHACPPGGKQEYLDEGRDASYTATCVGTTSFNGFYGDGIVNALGVVR